LLSDWRGAGAIRQRIWVAVTSMGVARRVNEASVALMEKCRCAAPFIPPGCRRSLGVLVARSGSAQSSIFLAAGPWARIQGLQGLLPLPGGEPWAAHLR